MGFGFPFEHQNLLLGPELLCIIDETIDPVTLNKPFGMESPLIWPNLGITSYKKTLKVSLADYFFKGAYLKKHISVFLSGYFIK